MNQSRGQAKALDKLVETYQKQTGVKVTIDSPGPSNFPAKLQAKSQSGDMPDIYSTLTLSEMVPYYKAGWAMNLQPKLTGEWKDNFAPIALDLTTVKAGTASGLAPGIYSAHWEIQTMGLLLNTKTLESAGVDPRTPPATTDAWIEQLKKISAKSGNGAFLMASSLADRFLFSHVSNWLSDAEIDATLAGKASWTADGWRKGLQLLAELRDAGVIVNKTLPGGDGDNPTVEKGFFNVQDTPVIFDASVAIGVARATAPDFTEYVSMGVPKATDGTHKPRVYGGVGKGACINPKGKNVDAAVKFVQWLTEPEQAKVFADEVGLIPANPKVKATDLPPQVAGFASLVDAIEIVPSPLVADVRTALVSGVQGLVLKEKTVDQVLGEMETAQKRVK
ncbi:extracellular solute-binding protein [Kribbella sp. NPDC050459]|uniref:ABC transporter substrate-binding protein n=1 Tax=Kribbella sp. NPDC050459 TaxID=3155785 RepID=UPI0033CEBBE9